MPGRTVIVGGGLAGLSCARELGRDFVLLEAEDRVGGLVRTDVVEGFSFDWTGHWLHARDPEMRELISSRWLAGNILEVQRRALIFSEGVWTTFPYQFHLHGLPAQTIADCVIGFVERDAERPVRNAADFVLRHLGEGFARHFMFPYNEKLYRVSCEELSPEWGGRFIPRPSLTDVVRGALGLSRDEVGYNATFWYPRNGGIESLARGLLSDVSGDVRVSARVESIDPARHHVRLANGEELSFEQVVLTIPLPAIATRLVNAPPAVREAASWLQAVSVTVVEIGARDNGGERFHWAYFPEARFPFYRIGSPSQVNPALAPDGCRSFAVEFSHRGPIEKERLIAQALDGLVECGLIADRDVLVRRARTIPVAYVLFDHAYAKARATVLDYLSAQGIQVAGRYGLWEYSSMEDALLSGREAARKLA
ncbi:MAG: NAD(P)/FAD-dependent oxidoreductase [Myxococcales bacterium]|nr:FAD-dependent oxidoreductase [Myxococcales bacterium]